MSAVWYDELEYADSRLRGSVVGSEKYGPVQIESMQTGKDGLFCLAVSITTGSLIEVKLEELSMTPLPLGFVTMRETAGFLYRLPSRRYRQGLNTQVLRAAHFRLRLPNNLCNFKPLLQAVNNDYPTIDTAIVMTEDVFESVAISRECAITTEGQVLWRAIPDSVGRINWDNGVITLNENHKFLLDIMSIRFGANRVR